MEQYGGPQSIPFDEALHQDGMNLHEWTGKTNNNNNIYIEHLFHSMDIEPVVPELVITEQPKPKDHRFRYPCEGRTAGALLGEKSTNRKKTCPEVKVANLATKALIVGSLVTKEENVKPHPFKLVGANCDGGIVKMIVTPQCPKAKFESLGIQCVKKADLKEAMLARKKLQVDPFNNIDQCLQEDIQDLDCKVLRICFQAYLEDPNTGQYTTALTPVLTQNIYNKKDSNLKIMRMNKREGTAKGGDEIYIFCEKVDKEDIQVVFSEETCEWKDYGQFGSSDVHHQIAIVLKTPAYKFTEIEEEITVKVRLLRTSDQDVSDSETFTYVPEIDDADQLKAKRRRTTPSWEENFALKDEEAGSSCSKHTDVRKKLKEKIKAKARRQSAKSRPPAKQNTPFSFPSVVNSSSFVSVGSDTTGYVTISPAKIESQYSMNIPDSFLYPGLESLNMTGTGILDIDPTVINIPVTITMDNGQHNLTGTVTGTALSAERLADIIRDLHENEPTLAEHNNMYVSNENLLLDGTGYLPQQEDYDMEPQEL